MCCHFASICKPEWRLVKENVVFNGVLSILATDRYKESSVERSEL